MKSYCLSPYSPFAFGAKTESTEKQLNKTPANPNMAEMGSVSCLRKEKTYTLATAEKKNEKRIVVRTNGQFWRSLKESSSELTLLSTTIDKIPVSWEQGTRKPTNFCPYEKGTGSPVSHASPKDISFNCVATATNIDTAVANIGRVTLATLTTLMAAMQLKKRQLL